MGLDPEIEEILNSIKNKEPRVEEKTTPIDLPPPKPRTEFTFTEEPAAKEEPPAPPEAETPEITEVEPIVKEEPVTTEVPVIEEPPVVEEQPAVEEAPVKKEKPKKEKAPKKKGALPIVLGALVLAAAIGLGAFFLSQNLYIRQYEKKYNMTFPVGIPRELCDFYGQNPTLAGSLKFGDYEGETLIYSEPKGSGGLFEKGSDINADQHYRAIAITPDDADIEALYKEADSFVSSTQSFTFKTIHGDEDTYQVIAAYYVNTNPEDDNGYAFPYNCYGNFTEKSYKHYEDTIKCRSLYTTGYKIAQEDYCLTVSVPTDIMPEFRFVIVGVKKEKVEKITETKRNPLLRYPQAYCDKLGIRNIYAQFAAKWYPEIVDSDGKTVQLSEKDFE